MALFKTNHYRIERNRVKQEENNGLTVTGVRVLLNTWCSKATEEQILSRIRDIMGDENEAPEKKNLPANWKAVRRRNHLSKGSLFLRPGKRKLRGYVPIFYSYHNGWGKWYDKGRNKTWKKFQHRKNHGGAGNQRQ